MKKYIYIALVSMVLLFSAYYYWQNRYVKLCPVVVNEDVGLVFFSETFHNQLFKFAAPNEVPKYYYKNIKYVLDRSGQEYIVKDGDIYIKYKYMHDMELIWNYTTRTTNPTWFNLKREMDSINGDTEKQKELDSIIKNLR
ncbi:hypothetical protein BC749_104346 [Flavobacterium araucananum]|uniref:Uncharacterized protein n=1 Tax=Flavobacterium araucananum TaxID=946678 RepID=A0A227PEI2_9FLAO|nr:hypothetical protein [Flavobacterium araucananum]OXG08287.1 hypothetical protein B0A64_05860 [Flavobacterium araucananum]PWJ99188.1 hypothetical protein BC749_104346 [Flavobacterium araucananum]